MNVRIILIVFLSLFSLNSWSLEVAVVDIRIAIFQSAAAQDALKEPQAQISAIEKQIQQENKELQAMSAALKRDELTLSKEEFETRQREIAQRNNALRNKVKNTQRQAQLLEQKLLASLKPKAEAILKKIIEEKKLDLLLNSQSSVYFKSEMDITNELTRRMNEGN